MQEEPAAVSTPGFLLFRLLDGASVTTVDSTDRYSNTGERSGARSHHTAQISFSRCDKSVGTQLFGTSHLTL